jgi:hypothetical protein
VEIIMNKLLASLGLAAATLLSPLVAQAATCQIIVYYQDAAKTKPVGHWSNCPGMKGLVGKRTTHKEVFVEQLVQPLPPPGTLPCEFLAGGCKPWGRR